MQRVFIVLCLFVLYSCQDKVICPAFQSAYILDDSTRNAFFSYAWQLDAETRAQFFAKNTSQTNANSEDTLQIAAVSQPKTDYYAYAGEKVVPWRVPKRTKYGIQKKVPYPVKNYRLRTAPMENVFAPEKVSNNFVASDFTDSLSLDSTSLALDSLEAKPVVTNQETKYLYKYDPKDNFNVEQEYYNKYFGDKFIDKRPQIAQNTPTATKDMLPDSLQAKEPFFKRLFKKKEKITDPVSNEPVEKSDQEEAPTEEMVEENDN